MWEQMPGHGDRGWGMPGVVGANGKLAAASRLCGLGTAPGCWSEEIHRDGFDGRFLGAHLTRHIAKKKKKKRKKGFGQGFWKTL